VGVLLSTASKIETLVKAFPASFFSASGAGFAHDPALPK